MTNLTHNSSLCIYFNSLQVSSNLVLIIRSTNCINKTFGTCHSASMTLCVQVGKFLPDLHTGRSPTQSEIYQMLYWCNWFSWWWARGCSKLVENWNKHIEKNCASNWPFTKNHNNMHAQQNIKLSNYQFINFFNSHNDVLWAMRCFVMVNNYWPVHTKSCEEWSSASDVDDSTHMQKTLWFHGSALSA
jgi:hypothetical protein